MGNMCTCGPQDEGEAGDNESFGDKCKKTCCPCCTAEGAAQAAAENPEMAAAAL